MTERWRNRFTEEHQKFIMVYFWETFGKAFLTLYRETVFFFLSLTHSPYNCAFLRRDFSYLLFAVFGEANFLTN